MIIKLALSYKIYGEYKYNEFHATLLVGCWRVFLSPPGPEWKYSGFRNLWRRTEAGSRKLGVSSRVNMHEVPRSPWKRVWHELTRRDHTKPIALIHVLFWFVRCLHNFQTISLEARAVRIFYQSGQKWQLKF